MRSLFALMTTLVAFASPIMSQHINLSSQLALSPELADSMRILMPALIRQKLLQWIKLQLLPDYDVP